MEYFQFYKEFIDLLRCYCIMPGNSQTKTAGRLDMKLQAFNDILNISKGMRTKTFLSLLQDMGVDLADILKLTKQGLEKRRQEMEAREKRKRK